MAETSKFFLYVVEGRLRMDIKWSAIVGTRNTPHLIKSFVERWKKVVPNGENYLIIVDSGIYMILKYFDYFRVQIHPLLLIYGSFS